jgi:hypothetical protein
MPVSIEFDVWSREVLETLQRIEETVKAINIAVASSAEMTKRAGQAVADYSESLPAPESEET